MNLNIGIGFNRLIERRDQFQRFTSLEAVDERRLRAPNGRDDAAKVLAEVVAEVRRIPAELLEHHVVDRLLVLEIPRHELVHEEPADDDSALLEEDAEMAFEIYSDSRRRRFCH